MVVLTSLHSVYNISGHSYGKIDIDCNASIMDSLAFLNAFPNYITWDNTDVSYEIVEGTSKSRSKVVKIQKKVHSRLGAGFQRFTHMQKRMTRVLSTNASRNVLGWLGQKHGGHDASHMVTYYLRVTWMCLSPMLYTFVALPVMGTEKGESVRGAKRRSAANIAPSQLVANTVLTVINTLSFATRFARRSLRGELVHLHGHGLRSED